jgi:hypothetical protein
MKSSFGTGIVKDGIYVADAAKKTSITFPTPVLQSSTSIYYWNSQENEVR